MRNERKDLFVCFVCIAFLLATLGAIGNRGRRRAKQVLCMSNLRRWGIIWQGYNQDHDGSWPCGIAQAPPGWASGQWVEVDLGLHPEAKIRFCPAATLKETEGYARGGPDIAWWRPGPYDPEAGPGWWMPQYSDYYGSYGLNCWLYNPPPGVSQIKGNKTTHNWRTCNVPGAANIPVHLASWWQGGFPEPTDEPPPYEGWAYEDRANEMRYFCVNRHEGYLNCLFMDLSVRKIALKGLWDLKWHRHYDMSVPDPYWPPWMENLTECE